MRNFKDYIESDGLTLVDFYATWCGPCKVMHGVLDEYKVLVGNEINVLKVDVDTPANREKVLEYTIKSVPTLIFFRSGEVLWRHDGVISAEGLKRVSDGI